MDRPPRPRARLLRGGPEPRPGAHLATFLAANIGASSTVGATSLGYSEGLSAWWWNGSAGLGSLVLALFVGPRMWREATAHGDFTVGDFLERRYGRAMRGTVGVLIWLGTLSILAAQLLGVAAVLNVVAGYSMLAGCIAGAVVTTAYFIAGGLFSSAWVNLVQLVVILAGFCRAVLGPGPPGMGARRLAARGRTCSRAPGRRRGGTFSSCWAPRSSCRRGCSRRRTARETHAPLHAASRGTVSRSWCSRCAGHHRPRRPSSPRFRARISPCRRFSPSLPPALGTLALAAVFSAEVSSADAVLFMLSTSASRDLYRGFVGGVDRARDVLRAARMAAVVGAVAGIGMAMIYGSVAARWPSSTPS